MFEERDDDGTDEEASSGETHELFKVMKKSMLLIVFKVEAVLLLHLRRSQIKEDTKIFLHNNREL